MMQPLASTLSVAALIVFSSAASALSIANAEVEVDWSSVSVLADPALTLKPNAGFYADTVSVAIGQAWFDSVTIPSSTLPRLNYQAPNSSVQVRHDHSGGQGHIEAKSSSDGSTGHATSYARDDDGDARTSNLISSNALRKLRFDVSGSGNLSISFDFSAYLSVVAEASWSNSTQANVWVNLYVQEYLYIDGGTEFVGSYRPNFTKQLTLLDGADSFETSETLSLDLQFAGGDERLVLIDISGQATSAAASGVVSSPIPSPSGLALLTAGVCAAAIGRSRGSSIQHG
jgi:hypothetical protein